MNAIASKITIAITDPILENSAPSCPVIGVLGSVDVVVVSSGKDVVVVLPNGMVVVGPPGIVVVVVVGHGSGVFS